LNGHPVHTSASFVGLDSCQCLPAVFPLADFFHQLFANGQTFCTALRRERFGPFRGHPRSFTPAFIREGQLQLVLLPPIPHELRRLLVISINPLRGPFGPSSLCGLLRPLLTSAVRSGRITPSSVPIPGSTADLPR